MKLCIRAEYFEMYLNRASVRPRSGVNALQALFDLVCTPEGQALNTAQMLVFQPPQSQPGPSKAGGRKANMSSADRDMVPLVVGAMHDATAIQMRVIGARALGQLAAALLSHAGDMQ